MKALILGVGGQDGSYLADVLLAKGYEVHGLYRRSSYDNLKRVTHCRDKINLHHGDVTDVTSVVRVLNAVKPQEVYNVADQDHIGWSYECPGVSWDVTAKAPAMILDAMYKARMDDVRFFQPVSSTIFGDASPPQDEATLLRPMSPYACAKAAALYAARFYREAYGMPVYIGIMYNHDSIRRRNEGYLLHQLAKDAVAVAKGKLRCMTVGSKSMVVDIGCAREYMIWVHKMLTAAIPGDYVFASNRSTTIGELAEMAMGMAGHGAPVVEDPGLLRPGNRPALVGNTNRSFAAFGFYPGGSATDVLQELVEREVAR